MKKILKLSISALFMSLVFASCDTSSSAPRHLKHVENNLDAMYVLEALETDYTLSTQRVVQDLATPSNPFYKDVLSNVIDLKNPSNPIKNPITVNVQNKTYQAIGTNINANKLIANIKTTPIAQDVNVVAYGNIDESILFNGEKVPLPLEDNETKTRINKIKNADIKVKVLESNLDTLMNIDNKNNVSIKKINSGKINVDLNAEVEFDTNTYTGYLLIKEILKADDLNEIQNTLNSAPENIKATITKIDAYNKANKQSPKPSVMPPKPSSKELEEFYSWLDQNIKNANVNLNYTFLDKDKNNPFEFLKITKISEYTSFVLAKSML